MTFPTLAFGIGCMGCFIWSCSKPKETRPKQSANSVLIQVGDSTLTTDMVTRLIPKGLSATDSIQMFDAIVEAWVDRNMLVNLAGSQLPDIEKIEAMVEKYREQLLANEYRRVMANDNVDGISTTDVQQYYDSHRDMLELKEPLVKGIYLKIENDAPQLSEVRTWLRNADNDDIDNLENYGLKGAMEYDYFGDTWVDWHTIADHIPYRFSDPDIFVAKQDFFECEDDGSIYMLRILDHLPSGQKAPFEYAEAGIRERLLEQQRGDYDRRLLNSLYQKGIDSRSIKPGSYIPLKYRNPQTPDNK